MIPYLKGNCILHWNYSGALRLSAIVEGTLLRAANKNMFY